MKTVESNGIKIKMYSSPKEAPIKRYTEFQKYLAKDIGIEHLKPTLERVKSFTQESESNAEMVSSILTELDNVQYIIDEINNGVNQASLAFASMVYSIDDVVYNDITEDGLKIVVEKLSDINITQYEIDTANEELKKKIRDEIELIFPDFEVEQTDLFFFTRMKTYILSICGTYEGLQISNNDRKELIKEKNWFVTKNPAKSLKQNSIDIERNFISLLSILELSPECTTIEFYAKIDYINKKNKYYESLETS